MVNKRIIVVVFLMLFFAYGCAGTGSFPFCATTRVGLEGKNFRVIQTSVSGASSGFNLLCIPIVPPSYSTALSRLYEKANLTPGTARALNNVVKEHSQLFLLLFSIPTIKVRADIVEFLDQK